MDALKRLLLAVSLNCPAVGYVQGMNHVAVTLWCSVKEDLELDGLELESTVFYLLMVVCETVPMYYSTNLMGTQVDTAVLGQLVRERLPRLVKSHRDLVYCLALETVPWLVTLFSQTFSYEFTRAAWRDFFLQGRIALLRISLAVVEWLQPRLIDCNGDLALLLQVIRESTQSITVEETECILAIARSSSMSRLVSEKHLKTISQAHMEEVQRQIADHEIRCSIADLQVKQEICFSNQEILQLKEDFLEMQQQQPAMMDGIDLKAFKEAMQRVRNSKDVGDRSAPLFRVFDRNGDGLLSLTELLIGMSAFMRGTRQDRLNVVFEAFDVDGNGALSMEEYVSMCRTLYHLHYETPPSDEEIVADAQIIFQSLDPDQKGLMALQEFYTGTLSKPMLAECFAGIDSPDTALPRLTQIKSQRKDRHCCIMPRLGTMFRRAMSEQQPANNWTSRGI